MPIRMGATAIRALVELEAASDGVARESGGNRHLVRASEISGTKQQRSAGVLTRLMGLGLVLGVKAPGARRGQWRWAITAAGRAELRARGQRSEAK